MSITNVHPRILEGLENNLPKRSKLVEIVSTSLTHGVIRYTNEYGTTISSEVEKTQVDGKINNRHLRLGASEGEKVGDLIAKMCRIASDFLPMVNGVDYDMGDLVVAFDENGEHEVTITILPDSPFLVGSFAVTFVNRDVPETTTEPLISTGLVSRDMFILLGEEFDVEGEFVVDNRLSEAAVASIIAYAKTRGGFKVLTKEILEKAPVRDTGDDGLTKHISIDTIYGSFGIRYK